MALNFLIQLAFAVGSWAVNHLLRPRHKRPRAANFDLEGIRADEGVPIPLGYGTFTVAPNVVMIPPDSIRLTPATNGATYYAANMVETLCLYD